MIIDSPIGHLKLSFKAGRLQRVQQTSEKHSTELSKTKFSKTDINEEVIRWFELYAQGETTVVQAEWFDLQPCTPFQFRVWMGLAKIPFGATTSYGELGVQLGRPKASRAVGTALGKNPCPVILPCHRILRAGGHLGGFAWGAETKSKLLKHEQSPHCA
jgi:methylated-DNA-[protein]-cysteine S-methyltransferase